MQLGQIDVGRLLKISVSRIYISMSEYLGDERERSTDKIQMKYRSADLSPTNTNYKSQKKSKLIRCTLGVLI